MPQGFYLIIPTKKIVLHDIVEFTPPSSVLDFIKEKHWVPKSGLIIKYVFAIPYDHVCIRNQALSINGKRIGRVYKFYGENKLLPQTKICGKLKEDQYLLLSTKSERSFDGRYFGVVSSREILGRAVPIFIYGLKDS
jgi:signal peptidase I